MRFANRVVIVTGGANGIGRAAAARFAAEGGLVEIWDVADELGAELQAELRQAGHRSEYQHVNVTDPANVEDAVRRVIARWGRVEVLVNNAAILRDAQLVKFRDGNVLDRLSLEDFDAVIDVNLRGVFLCMRAVAPGMIQQRYGRVVNLSSVVGLYGNFGQTNYVASKAGIIGMTRVWARELGRHNITVNALAPGFIETEMTRQMPPKILELMINRTPLHRLGRPEEIASAILYLSSEEASFITGATLSVDGGVVVGT